jgi:hypothetical protein
MVRRKVLMRQGRKMSKRDGLRVQIDDERTLTTAAGWRVLKEDWRKLSNPDPTERHAGQESSWRSCHSAR